MKKYYTERSFPARWDKALPHSITNEILKNKRRAPYSRNIFQSELKFAPSSTNYLSPSHKLLGEQNKNTRFDSLISKISTISKRQSKVGAVSEKFFKKSVSNNIKSIHKVNADEENEKKQVVRQFSDTVKGNMFTISKSGQKFRELKLRKHLGQFHVKGNQ